MAYYDYDYDDEHMDEDEDGGDNSFSINFSENFYFCVKPVVNVWVKHFCILACACFATKLAAYLFFRWRHIFSIIFGTAVLYYFFDWLLFFIISHVVVSFIYLEFLMKSNTKRNAHLLTLCTVIFLISCEFLMKSTLWQKIRGPHMLIAMKTISLVYDHSSSSQKALPGIQEYLGYTLSPGSSVFGPWISYKDYLVFFEVNYFSWKWCEKILERSFISLIHLLFSACWFDLLLPVHWHHWVFLYRRAITIRFSHYFISSLSEAANMLAGGRIETRVTSPLEIELPYSMMQVVKHWNIPMHRWLKQYVFRVSQEFGSFFAVLATYVVSASLHGFNFRLAGILISLGFYSYVEYIFRKKLSIKWNACISAKPCPTYCEKHEHTERKIAVKFFNTLFTFLNIFHLVYLGILLDFNTDKEQYNSMETFNDWKDLNYISHGVALGMFFLHTLIRAL
nr:PREDICTED: protein-serine O-palmitoleoyltransferase porcupine [Bemisia tabaci]